jgi:hypothetical protein
MYRMEQSPFKLAELLIHATDAGTLLLRRHDRANPRFRPAMRSSDFLLFFLGKPSDACTLNSSRVSRDQTTA